MGRGSWWMRRLSGVEENRQGQKWIKFRPILFSLEHAAPENFQINEAIFFGIMSAISGGDVSRSRKGFPVKKTILHFDDHRSACFWKIAGSNVAGTMNRNRALYS